MLTLVGEGFLEVLVPGWKASPEKLCSWLKNLSAGSQSKVAAVLCTADVQMDERSAPSQDLYHASVAQRGEERVAGTCPTPARTSPRSAVALPSNGNLALPTATLLVILDNIIVSHTHTLPYLPPAKGSQICTPIRRRGRRFPAPSQRQPPLSPE